MKWKMISICASIMIISVLLYLTLLPHLDREKPTSEYQPENETNTGENTASPAVVNTPSHQDEEQNSASDNTNSLNIHNRRREKRYETVVQGVAKDIGAELNSGSLSDVKGKAFYEKWPHEDFEKFKQRIEEAAAKERIDSELYSLSGVVADDNGMPIPGVKVSINKLRPIKYQQTRSTSLMHLEKLSFSKIDGTFSFYNLPPGRKLVVAAKQGYRQVKIKNLYINKTEGPGKRHKNVNILLVKLASSHKISGICLDSTGNPVTNASLIARMIEYADKTNFFSNKAYSTLSDNGGNFYISGLPLGKVLLRAMAKNYKDVIIDSIQTNSKGVELVFKEECGSVSGTVEIPTDNALKILQITLNATTKTARTVKVEIPVEGTTLEFIFPEVQPGKYQLHVLATGFARTIVDNIEVQVSQDVNGIIVILSKGATISGKVKWKKSDKYVPLARIALKPGKNNTATTKEVTANSRGEFSIESIPAGAYLISASIGTITSPNNGTEITLSDGENRQIELELPKGKTIRGQITFVDKKSNFGSFRITCHPEKARPINSGVSAGGYFAFHNLAPGGYTISIMDAGSKGLLRTKRIELTAEKNARADFKLEGITIKGSVTIRGKPYRNQAFSLKGESVSCMVLTDEFGNYVAMYIPPGKYTASFVDPFQTGPAKPQITSELTVPENLPEGQSEFTQDFDL